MMKQSQLAALALVLASSVAPSGSALAGGQADAVGVGAEYMLNGLAGGLSVNYDLGNMHVGGFFGLRDTGDGLGDDTTDFTLGGRFFYHLHSTAMSDFSVGGMLGFYSNEYEAGDNTNRDTYLYLEPSAQIRVFVAANVALSFSMGIVLALQDDDGFAITGAPGDDFLGGNVTGAAGIHYYFF